VSTPLLAILLRTEQSERMGDPKVWGTVAQWVGSLGTTSAFFATFYVILKDAKVRRQAQASHVAYYLTDSTSSRTWAQP
jgi:hypothetical protein